METDAREDTDDVEEITPYQPGMHSARMTCYSKIRRVLLARISTTFIRHAQRMQRKRTIMGK